VLWLITCGPRLEESAQAPITAALCARNKDVTLQFLAVLLALSQLPEGGGQKAPLQAFPQIDPRIMAFLVMLSPRMQPDWEVVANPDIERIPEIMRPQVIDAVSNAYGTMQRLLIAQALPPAPEVIFLDEPTGTTVAPSAVEAAEAVSVQDAAPVSQSSADAAADVQIGPEGDSRPATAD